MEIRPLTAADRADWDPLWTGYLTFYEEDLDAAVTEETFARLTGDHPAMRGWVAADGDALVGLVHVVTHPSTWAVDDHVYLEDLFVASEGRLRGTGRALIEAVYAFAGARQVYWHTQAGNATARRLYDRIARDSGFVMYER